MHNENEMLLQLGRRVPPIKVIKLHGDLHHRLFAFTPEEIWQFSDRIEQVLRDFLKQDLIISGHSMRDNDINRCIDRDGGAVWYINPSEPASGDTISQVLGVRSGEVVAGEMGYFDNFFVALRNTLLGKTSEGQRSPSE